MNDDQLSTPMSEKTQVSEKTEFEFQASVTEVLRLVIDSLYSNPEIFLRELVSNAADAIDKRKFRAISEPEILGEEEPKIRLIPDREAKTLTIEDDGIGMSREELIEYLGTVAHSGTREFAKAIEEARSEEHTSELQSRPHLVCRLLLEKKKTTDNTQPGAFFGSVGA